MLQRIGRFYGNVGWFWPKIKTARAENSQNEMPRILFLFFMFCLILPTVSFWQCRNTSSTFPFLFDFFTITVREICNVCSRSCCCRRAWVRGRASGGQACHLSLQFWLQCARSYMACSWSSDMTRSPKSAWSRTWCCPDTKVIPTEKCSIPPDVRKWNARGLYSSLWLHRASWTACLRPQKGLAMALTLSIWDCEGMHGGHHMFWTWNSGFLDFNLIVVCLFMSIRWATFWI